MASKMNPYISFGGNAREALTFYQEVFGGTMTVSTFGEFGQADTPFADQIMHGMLETPSGFTIMAADTPPGMEHNPGDNIAVSISGDDDLDLHGYWEQLSASGTIAVPMEKQMWGDEFGMCTDRFGIGWLVNVTQA